MISNRKNPPEIWPLECVARASNFRILRFRNHKFPKTDIRANQFSDFPTFRNNLSNQTNFRKTDDACYDFYSLCLWSDKFSCPCARAKQFSDFFRAETVLIFLKKIDPIKGSIVCVLCVQFHCVFVVFCW